MNTTDEPQASSAASPLPTGESQIGVVRRPTAPQAEGPVLEHSVAVPEAPPEEAVASQPVPSEPAPSTPSAPAPAPQAAAASPVRVNRALQESPKVSIPERMNHLSTENQRLRDELQALEEALNRKPE